MINLWREGLLFNKPRWMVLLVDMLIISTGFVISYILIFKHRGVVELDNLFGQLLIVSTIYLFWILIFGTYKSVMHKTGIRDLQQLVVALVLAYISVELLSKLIEWIVPKNTILQSIVPFSDTQLLFHALIAGFGMTFLRVLYRSIYHELVWNQKDNRIPVILFGAGNMEIRHFTLFTRPRAINIVLWPFWMISQAVLENAFKDLKLGISIVLIKLL